MVQIPMDLCETRIIGPNTREWIIAGESQEALRKHHIVETGLSDAAPPYRMVRPAPPDMHLLICIAGEGRVLVDGEWQVCGPGQAYLSPAGEPMAFHAIPNKRWIFGWIYYATPAAERLFPQPGAVLRQADPTLFETSFRGLHREVQSHGDESVVGAWTHLLHTACLRLLKPPQDIRIGEVVRMAETDFRLVECFDAETNSCTLSNTCRMKRLLDTALAAYFRELDGATLADIVGPPTKQRSRTGAGVVIPIQPASRRAAPAARARRART